ncbi:MAG: acyltransferase [Pacificimonas sp.]|jgi:peptidoglycan/LPS O-acetylase OafA/YrhL|nr:acyltransferase [Pacificimonas sp.]
MQYRADVDGLRAIAVVPVMLFHAGIYPFSGGYVGVDVFFVISGFLITGILVDEMNAGSFSLIDFYERRARRILPALFVIMLACIPFAWAWMLPDPLENFGQSLLATALFSNNMLLYFTSGYWDLAAEFKPLLHTWSLGIEEQYYIVFPIALLALLKAGLRTTLAVLFVILLASLIAAEMALNQNPSASFYLLPMRAWELMMGALAAFYVRRQTPIQITTSVCNLLSLAGLLLIMLSVALFRPETPFPGLTALVPTMGTVLILLFSRQGTWCCRVLSLPLFVGMGLISYSAYLWHQPLLAFARIYSIEEPSLAIRFTLLVATVILAALTWKFVENPVRNRKRFGKRWIWTGAAAGTAFFCAIGFFLHTTQGAPGRLYASAVPASADTYISYNMRVFERKANRFETEQPRMLVVGNSFARDFVNMLNETGSAKGVELVYRDDFLSCFDDMISDPVFATLYDQADMIVQTSADLTPDCVMADIARAENDGKTIFLVGSKHFGYNLNWVARTPEGGRSNLMNPILEEWLDVEAEFQAVVPPSNYLSLFDRFTDGEYIRITNEKGELLTSDRIHLTRQGAIDMGGAVLPGSRFVERLDAIKAEISASNR